MFPESPSLLSSGLAWVTWDVIHDIWKVYIEQQPQSLFTWQVGASCGLVCCSRVLVSGLPNWLWPLWCLGPVFVWLWEEGQQLLLQISPIIAGGDSEAMRDQWELQSILSACRLSLLFLTSYPSSLPDHLPCGPQAPCIRHRSNGLT